MQKSIYVSSFKKIVRAVFEILTSDFISGFVYPTSEFSIFTKAWQTYLHTYLALCTKFVVSVFIRFEI